MMVPPGSAAILLVEDDEFHRAIGTKMLRVLGYLNITTAVNGREAVDACKESTFDLILMDCDMPLMNGFDATRQIRALKVRTPIVAFTSTETPEHMSRCAEAGMDDFLAKPAHIGKLASTLARWLAIPRN
jgi:CheY-like chemotaxis protein